MFKRRKIDETGNEMAGPFSEPQVVHLPPSAPDDTDHRAVDDQFAASSQRRPSVIADALAASQAAPPLVDDGLGVPPFRPALPKEPPMGRTPFNTPGNSNPVASGGSVRPSPLPGPRPPAASGLGSAGMGAMPGGGQGAGPAAARERRTLVVGHGISVQGTVQDAERLVVEGTVEASMIHATELAISPGGTFKGEIEVEDAEIAGTIDGTLMARGNLIVRATGKVLGTARCRRLQVEDGGQITGRIEMLADAGAPVRTEARPMPAAAVVPGPAAMPAAMSVSSEASV